MSYEVFARFYDSVMGDRSAHLAELRDSIRKHHPDAKTVLELGCGTGSVLEDLSAEYEVCGVDTSAEMLDVAARKLPEARLVQAEMTVVQLEQAFDVVLSICDAINHLPTFEEWERVFDLAWRHLDEGGVFIFDVVTQRGLAQLIHKPMYAQWFGDGNLLLVDVVQGDKGDEGSADLVFSFLEPVGDSMYKLHRDRTHHVAFPAGMIEASLKRRFREVSPDGPRVFLGLERLVFVCKK